MNGYSCVFDIHVNRAFPFPFAFHVIILLALCCQEDLGLNYFNSQLINYT